MGRSSRITEGEGTVEIAPGSMHQPSLLAPGELLARQYRVLAPLAQGGMGAIYHCEDIRLKRSVAVKIAHTTDMELALEREAQALAAIIHPCVPVVHALCRTDADVSFMVMELINGETLAAQIVQRRVDQTSFSIEEVVGTLLYLADGLVSVHRSGVAHRDIKPENIMVTAEGRLILLDFGIFRPDYQRVNPEALVCGTPGYIAPEEISARTVRGAAHLADLYATGILGFEMLVGKRPFEHGNFETELRKQLAHDVPDVRTFRDDVPEEMAFLLRTLTHRDPSRRPQDTEEVSWRIRALAEHLNDPEQQKFRRSHPRYENEVAVRYGTTSALNEAKTVDLSASGLSIEAPFFVSRGRQVVMRLALPTGTVALRGRVKWHKSKSESRGNLMGIAFGDEPLPEQYLDYLRFLGD